ncbi:reverse transcriptase domain-containing protein [Tanacetum coccineum]
MPTAPEGFKFLAIAIEHSTKWVEAKPLTVINGRHAERFVWEYVVYRFGVPRTISSKDEKHLREGIFADLCKGLKVTQSFSPITEHMEIMNHIEKQLARSQQGWVDDLAQVLWVHRTLLRNSQKETPFSLTYGSKAIIPISENDVAKDDRGRIKEVDKRRGSKEIALIKEAYYRSKLRRHHNKRSSHSIYKIGDFVVSGESSSGQVFQEEQAPSTLGNQKQDDDFDFWTDSYATDDDEIPTKQVSQDIMEEVLLTIDEAKLRKMADEMLRQRCTSGDEHQYHIDQMKNFLKSDIVWESRKEITR